MASISTNLILTLWDNLTDPYDSSELVDNFVKIDLHDHGAAGGVKISNAGLNSTSGSEAVNTNVIRNQAVTSDKIANGAVNDLKITSGGLSPSKITGTAVITTDSRLSDPRPPDFIDFAWTATGSNPTYSGSFTSTTVSSIIRQSGTFTGTATIALPPASRLPAGSEIIVQAGANVSSTNTISIVRAGGQSPENTINGVNTAVVIGAAYGFRRFITDGVSSWVYDAGVVRTSTGVSDLTFGSTGLKATSGSSPWNGSAPATIDIDNTKVPTISGSNTVSFITSGTTSLTGTVLTTTNNQVLTNKSLSDSTTYIVDSADNTKRVNINVTGTTGITGTLQTAFTTAKTIAFPDTAGTVITSGDTNTVTSTMILDGTIQTADVANSSNASTGITVNKIQYAPAAGTSKSYILGGPTDGTLGVTSFRQIFNSDISDPALSPTNGISGTKIQVLSIPANRLTGVPWGPKSLYVNSSQSIPVTGPTIGDEIYYPAFGTANIISTGGSNDTIRVIAIDKTSVTLKPTNPSQSLENIFSGSSSGGTSYVNRSYTLNCSATGINSATAQPFNSNVSSITINLIDSLGIYYPPQIGNFVSGVGIVNGTFVTDVQPDDSIANRYDITLSANTNSTQSGSTTIAITGTGFDKTSFTIPGSLKLQATLATGTNAVTLTSGSTRGLSVGQSIFRTSTTGGVFATGATIASIINNTQFTASSNHATSGSVTFDVGRLRTVGGSVTVPLNNASGVTTNASIDQISVITEVPKQLWHLRFSGPGWHYVGGTPLVKKVTSDYNVNTGDLQGGYTRSTGGWYAQDQGAAGTNVVPNGSLDMTVPILGTYKVDISGTARFNIDATNQNGPSNSTTLEYSFGLALATLQPSRVLNQYTIDSNVYQSNGDPLSYATYLSNPSAYTGAYTDIYISTALPLDFIDNPTGWSKHTRLYFQGVDANGNKWFVTGNQTDYDGAIKVINDGRTVVTVNRPIFIGSYNSAGTTFTPGSVTLGNSRFIEAYSWKKINESDIFATCAKYSNATGSAYGTASGTYIINLNQTKNEARILKPVYSVAQGPSNGYNPLTVASESLTLTPVSVGYTMPETDLQG